MFGPRLPEMIVSAPNQPIVNPAASVGPLPRMARSGGDLADRRSVAPFEEWGHAVEAPTDALPVRPLGMPPFTV